MRPSLVFVLLAACHSDVHYVSVAAGLTSCAVTSDGHVTCWGPGARKEIAIDDAVEISGNSPHYCVRTRGGAVRCWGKVNELGLRPDAQGVADVSLPAPAIGVAVGGSHACALLVTRQVACWGRNNYLQLGTLDVGAGPADTVPPRVIPSLYAPVVPPPVSSSSTAMQRASPSTPVRTARTERCGAGATTGLGMIPTSRNRTSRRAGSTGARRSDAG